MAGRPRTRARMGAVNTAPLPPEMFSRRAAQAFFATGGGDEPGGDEMRELGQTVANKARLARLADTADAANRILNPGGGEDVSTEALTHVAGVYRDGAVFQQQQAAAERERADKATAALANARAEGAAEAARQYETQRAADASIAQMAMAAMERSAAQSVTVVRETTAATVQSAEKAAEARVAAAHEHAAFFEALATRLLPAAAGPAAAGPTAAAATPFGGIMDFLKLLEGLRAIMPAPHVGESAADYERRALTDARVKAWEKQNETSANAVQGFLKFLTDAGGPVLSGFGRLLMQKAITGAGGQAFDALPGADAIVPGGPA